MPSYENIKRKARKKYICDKCKSEIKIGELYNYYRDTSAGYSISPSTRWCNNCGSK